MDDANLSSLPEDKYLGLPYNERLERLKPVIIKLYMEDRSSEGTKLTKSEIVTVMQRHYSLSLSQNQLDYLLRKWKVRRRTLAREKDEITTALGKRTHPGTSTSNVSLQQGEEGEEDKQVDKKQLKRYLNDKIRHHKEEAMVPGVFSSWNLPYAALLTSVGGKADEPSPYGLQRPTPTHINIDSPTDLTPGRQEQGPSPTTQLVRRKAIQDMSNLFLQGRHKQLLETCGREDRIILSNYLHEFWVHTFVTAKYWGRGPQGWTREMVSILTLDGSNIPNVTSPPVFGPLAFSSPRAIHDLQPPSKLCQWVIHVDEMEYVPISEPEPQAFDINDPSSWREWPDAENSRGSFLESMANSITSSSFTAISPQELPVATDSIIRSVESDPDSLLVDACKFAIMAGNGDLLGSLLDQDDVSWDRVLEIHPFHLAANFIDGGNTCCTVMSTLCSALRGGYRVSKNNIDNLGHTVLDTIVISILRSHTSVAPDRVSSSFRDTTRYPGEEKDICGRWDADSPEIRKLFQCGTHRVPHEWKHPFCHSSVQAACHMIITIYSDYLPPDINDLSGLFSRRCSHCGLELKLTPLHTVAIMTFHLAQFGVQGETLFGAVAILMCLLRLGADVNLTTHVSVEGLLDLGDTDECSHKAMGVDELMQALPDVIISRWSPECQTGWYCMREIIRLAKGDTLLNYKDGDGLDNDRNRRIASCEIESYYPAHSGRYKWPCADLQIGLLWASVQTEFLTYRRVSMFDPWISQNFSMKQLRRWLQGETREFCIPLVQNVMMKKHSRCGWFTCNSFKKPIAEEVCNGYFMNMDIYGRTSFNTRD